MTSLKTSIKTITYLSDIGCLEIQGASLLTEYNPLAVTPAAHNPLEVNQVCSNEQILFL
ncbi:DNA methylase [Escherichia coli]|nr:DNA methylase [Escherichia coli]